MGISIKRLDGPLAGQVYVERDDIAENLIDVGSAERATFEEYTVTAQPVVETPGRPASGKPLSKMSRAELEAEAVRRNISIVAGTGTNGAVLKRDIIAALR